MTLLPTQTLRMQQFVSVHTLVSSRTLSSRHPLCTERESPPPPPPVVPHSDVVRGKKMLSRLRAGDIFGEVTLVDVTTGSCATVLAGPHGADVLELGHGAVLLELDKRGDVFKERFYRALACLLAERVKRCA